MSLPPFRKQRSGDAAVDALQDNVDAALGPVLGKEILDGVLVASVELLSGVGTRINHGLGRRPLGYLAVASSAEATIFGDVNDSPSPRLYLILTASHHTTSSFWIF